MVCLELALCNLYDESHESKKSTCYKSFPSALAEKFHERFGSKYLNESSSAEIGCTNHADKDPLIILDIVSRFLDEEIKENGNYSEPDFDSMQAFRGPHRSFTASYYVKRMMKYSNASPCCCIVSLIYLKRLQARIPTLRLTASTIQRLLLVIFMEATKFIEDSPVPNTTWRVNKNIILPLYFSPAMYFSFCPAH